MNVTAGRSAPSDPRAGTHDTDRSHVEALRLSDQLERWLTGSKEKTLGGLLHAFGDKSFAILFVLLLGIPALPLPTGGLTHIFELVAGLVALELIAGRDEVWLPRRWRALELAGPRQQRFIAGLMRLIRRLERYSRPRLRSLFRRRVSDVVLGLLAIAGTSGAFLAPPFSGLDTLPALGVVVLALGVLLEDAVIALVGTLLATAGIALELALGAVAVHGLFSVL
jgi:hypothetical protein